MTFDEVYGRDPGFVSGLEELGERYIGEVPKDTRIWRKRPAVQEPGPSRGRGAPRTKPRVAPGQPAPQTAEQVAAAWPATAWQRLSFREGSKGVQYAEFARVRLVAERADLPGPDLWLVVQRGSEQHPEVKYYLSNAEVKCPLREQARAAHMRWPVETCQADYPSSRRGVGTRRIGYHRRNGVARAGRVVPATPGRSHRSSRMSNTTRRPTPPRA